MAGNSSIIRFPYFFSRTCQFILSLDGRPMICMAGMKPYFFFWDFSPLHWFSAFAWRGSIILCQWEELKYDQKESKTFNLSKPFRLVTIYELGQKWQIKFQVKDWSLPR